MGLLDYVNSQEIMERDIPTNHKLMLLMAKSHIPIKKRREYIEKVNSCLGKIRGEPERLCYRIARASRYIVCKTDELIEIMDNYLFLVRVGLADL